MKFSSVAIQFFVGILTIIFAYYGFFRYKRYVKRHRLRVGIWTELLNAKRDSRVSYENLEDLEDVSIFDYGKNSSKFYDASLGQIHLLTDIEIHVITLAYDRLVDRERYLEIIDSREGLDGELKEETDLALAGQLEIESALEIIEKQMNKEVFEGRVSWYKLEKFLGVRKDLLNGRILKLIRTSSESVMDAIHSDQ